MQGGEKLAYIALDIGSSYLKGAVLYPERLEISFYRQEVAPPNQSTISTRYEVDAEALFKQVQRMLDGLLAMTPESQGILLCTQMHGYVLTDHAFCPVSPYVTWQDRASTEERPGGSTLDVLKNILPERAMESAGVPVKANLAMCSLAARGKQPEGALFNTLGGYLIGRLSGVHVCHLTNAAPTGMTDVKNGTWQEELIKEAGLEGLKYPHIFTGLEKCGIYHFQGRSYPLFPDIGDQQACVMGALLRPETDLSVNIGTAGLISRATKYFSRGNYETRPYFGLYLNTISGLEGGRNLEALVNREAKETDLTQDEIWKVLTSLFPDKEATSPVEIEGERLYRQMSESYREAKMRLGNGMKRIVYSGGCTRRNPALREWLKQAMGFQFQTEPMQMDSMNGLLQMALVLDGQAADFDQARMIMEKAEVEGA